VQLGLIFFFVVGKWAGDMKITLECKKRQRCLGDPAPISPFYVAGLIVCVCIFDYMFLFSGRVPKAHVKAQCQQPLPGALPA
jgi:hypothetical protein